MKAGDSIGTWLVSQRLGRGGNGEVWRASNTNGDTVAIKVLHRRDRIARFRDEVRFLADNAGTPGVLPMLEHSLPDGSRELAWYAMPIATPLRTSLGQDPAPQLALAAMAATATTLARLHSGLIFHRDVKPDNLFRLGTAWVVGDFGLVSYPDKDAHTEHGRRLGPIDYMAPEMRMNADQADPGPADVYALAKTTWVAVTSSELPLPGQHREDDEMCSLAARINFGRAAELDRLLANATSNAPASRPSMSEYAAELAACLEEVPERRPGSSRGVLATRIQALTAAGRRREETADELNRLYGAASAAMNEEVLAPSYHELAESLPGFRSNYINGNLAITELLEPVNSMHGQLGWDGTYFEQGSQHPLMIRLATGVRLLTADSPITLCAYVAVERSHPISPTVTVTFGEVTDVPLGSARQATAITRMATLMAASLDETLRVATEELATARPEPDPAGLAARVQVRLAVLRGVEGEAGNLPRLVLGITASEPALNLEVTLAGNGLVQHFTIARLSRGTSHHYLALAEAVPAGRYRVAVTDGSETLISRIRFAPQS